MKKVVRPLDLKSKEGILIMDLEDNPTNLKEGIYYLYKKSHSIKDENFIAWLKVTEKTDLTKQIKYDIFTKDLAFLQTSKDLVFGVNLALDYLFEANGLNKKEVEHIIPDPK